MKKVFILLFSFISMHAMIAQVARVQVIHNSADLAADSVDVYLKTIKILDNFAFRTATPFISVPAGVPEIIGIAPKGSTSVADTIYSLTVTLTANEKYILVANGIVSSTGYSPAATAVPFRVSVYPMARESADTTGRTDVLVVHGSTDAPTVDVRAGSSVLVDDISFGQFNSTGYLSLPTADYTIDITNAMGSTVVQSYSAPLSTLGLTDSAITVVASGFLDSTVNSNGAAFGLWVALAKGGELIPLSVATPTSLAELNSDDVANIYPNPANHIVNIVSKSGVFQSISVIDANGKTIAKDYNTENSILDISAFPQGMYLIQMLDVNGKLYIEKFIKN
jgi:hypothetical protein